MTTFRKIVPNSSVNEINERYEHFLVWLSKDGGVRNWFFSHTAGSETEGFKGFEIETLTDIRSITTEDRTMVDCTTRFMDSDQFDYVRSIFASNRVYKVSKDGSKTPVSIKGEKVTRNNKIKNFEISLSFQYKEGDTLNV